MMEVQMRRPHVTYILAGMVLFTLSAPAAEYQGHNIDGRLFPAEFYGYKGAVTFKGKAAVFQYRKAIQIRVDYPKSKDVRLLLCNEKIQNPYHIKVTFPGEECPSPPDLFRYELRIPELDTTDWPK